MTNISVFSNAYNIIVKEYCNLIGEIKLQYKKWVSDDQRPA